MDQVSFDTAEYVGGGSWEVDAARSVGENEGRRRTVGDEDGGGPCARGSIGDDVRTMFCVIAAVDAEVS